MAHPLAECREVTKWEATVTALLARTLVSFKPCPWHIYSSDTARVCEYVCVCVSACLCVWDTASFSGEDSFQNSSQKPEVKWEICTPWGLRESLGSEASPQCNDSWLGESA